MAMAMKMWLIIWCFILFFGDRTTSTPELSAIYRCGTTGTGVVIHLYNNTKPFQSAYIPGFKDDVNCQPSFTYDQNGWTTATFRLSYFECGMDMLGDYLDKWTVLVTENALIEQETDLQLTALCNFDEEQTQFVDMLYSVGNITHVETDANVSSEYVTMVMKRSKDDMDINSCSLGESVYLSMTLQPSETAKGIKVFGCTVKPAKNSPDNETFVLLNDDGCPDDDKFIENPFWESGVKSGTFKCFKFPDKTDLYFSCTIGFCISENIPRCTEGPRICSVTNRKKRWLTNDEISQGSKLDAGDRNPLSELLLETEPHYGISLRVSVTRKPEPKAAVFNNNGGNVSALPKSEIPPVFTATIAVLASLLLIAFIAMIVITRRLSKSRQPLLKNVQTVS